MTKFNELTTRLIDSDLIARFNVLTLLSTLIQFSIYENHGFDNVNHISPHSLNDRSALNNKHTVEDVLRKKPILLINSTYCSFFLFFSFVQCYLVHELRFSLLRIRFLIIISLCYLISLSCPYSSYSYSHISNLLCDMSVHFSPKALKYYNTIVRF